MKKRVKIKEIASKFKIVETKNVLKSASKLETGLETSNVPSQSSAQAAASTLPAPRRPLETETEALQEREAIVQTPSSAQSREVRNLYSPRSTASSYTLPSAQQASAYKDPMAASAERSAGAAPPVLHTRDIEQAPGQSRFQQQQFESSDPEDVRRREYQPKEGDDMRVKQRKDWRF